MFGYVTASLKELDKDMQQRYGAVYCGIGSGSSPAMWPGLG